MALEEACEYGLLSRDTVTASNISCVHVKLTDSALKVIEDLKNGNVSVAFLNLIKNVDIVLV